MERSITKSVRAPTRWATDLTRVLNAILGPDHFPIKIDDVARELSLQMFPEAPIVGIGGENIEGFEGCLVSVPGKGWGIAFNNQIHSPGRINFTLAHEFGHYLCHRLKFPDGLKCTQDDLTRWEDEYKTIEIEANLFASHFLMPLDDFRKQLPSAALITLNALNECASRYGVSLTAAALRWLSYTDKRAVFVASRDGFILWARSSDAAFKSGAFFKNTGSPRPIPNGSGVASRRDSPEQSIEVRHGAGVWFPEAVTELTLFADRYDLALSLLLLDDGGSSWPSRTDDDDDGYTAEMEIMRLRRQH